MKMKRVREIKRVAILVDSSTSWSRLLIEGILEYSKIHGPWHIHLEPQPRDQLLHLPEGWEGDGIICRVASKEIADRLHTLNLPVVNISAMQIEGADFPRVITSPESEARLILETFKSRGFRNLAYLGDLSQAYVIRHCSIVESEIKKAGIRMDRFSTAEGRDMTEWLKNLPKPVGLICWGPSLGHQVIDACQLAGIIVPHDVAVLGTDYDELLSEASYPPQAGVRFNVEQIGMTAASVLDCLMQGEVPKQKEWLLEPKGIVEKLSIDTVAVEDRRMASVMRYLKEHALEPISVNDILKANPMARRSMERKFRQLYGCSIVDQIRQLRINHARKLLAETDEPVTVIAEECGFSSYNYLNRVFKQATGLTPSQYRAEQHAGPVK
ncbi:helix-turn-helix domain-containing protein [Verrucomicrobia bacterium S94]|nr:helix-turn-helix domain-containing protein [Verrucomicrobia bacterium S94]